MLALVHLIVRFVIRTTHAHIAKPYCSRSNKLAKYLLTLSLPFLLCLQPSTRPYYLLILPLLSQNLIFRP
jgi:hypothetical protein